MTVLLSLVGTALILFTLVDVFKTVFMIGGGAGPQSGFLADRTWRLALRLHDPECARSHSRMRSAGPLIVLMILVAWTLELVLGWALLFPATAFEEPDSRMFADRLLFATTAIIGRTGNTPALAVDGDGWEILHSLAGLTGVFILSVGIAYVLPILGAVAHKRSIAAKIHTLGDGVADMLELGRTPNGSSFELHLVALVDQIGLTAERHRAYPVLHYFHSHDRRTALAPAIAKIALFLREDLDDVDKVDATVRVPLERAIANLLGVVSAMGLERYARDVPDLDDRQMDSIELHPAAPGGAHDRTVPTRWLEAYVRFDGWRWSTVAPQVYVEDADAPAARASVTAR